MVFIKVSQLYLVSFGLLLSIVLGDIDNAKIVLLIEDVHENETMGIDPYLDINQMDTSYNLNLTIIDLNDVGIFHIRKIICDSLSDGAVLIMTHTLCQTVSIVSSVLTGKSVPLLNLRDSCTDFNGQMAANLFNYHAQMPKLEHILVDVLKETEWESFIFISDHNQGGTYVDLNVAATRNNITMLTFYVEDSSIHSILDYIHWNNAAITNIIIACSFDCVTEILETALYKESSDDFQGLFTYRVKFLVVAGAEPMRQLESHVQDLDHVSLVSTHTHVNNSLTHVIQSVQETLREGLSNRVVPASPTTITQQECDNTFPLVNDVTQILQDTFDESSCPNCTSYEVHAAFYKAPHRMRDFQVVGRWSEQGYEAIAPVFPNLRNGFNGRFFRIGTNVWDPFVKYDVNSTHGFDGLCIQLLRELSRDLNFTYTLFIPPDGGWGILQDGNWTGLVGLLQNKDADMVVAPIASNIDRERVMDFTEAFYIEYTSALVRYTDLNADKWRLYLQPFRWESWLCFLIAIPIGAFFVWLVTRLTPYYPCHGEKACKEAYEGLGTFNNALLSTFGAFFQQGSVWLPQAQSVRFIVGFWWMYSIVVMATYSGNLIAYLTVTKTELPFDSLEEMVAMDDFKFGTMGGTITEHSLSKARSGIEKELWDKMKKWYKRDKSILSGNQTLQIDRVLDEDYAYINDRTGFELEMSRTCDVGMISDLFLPSEYCVGLQNNSYFLQDISLDVIKIKETGLINKLKAEYWPRPSFCSTGMQTEAKAVSLTDVQGAYYAMAILLGLALIALLSEAVVKFSKFRITFRKKKQGHSGGYMDELPNGGVHSSAYGQNEYFDFSLDPFHSNGVGQHGLARRNGSVMSNGKANGVHQDVSNGHAHSNGHAPTSGIWTYGNTRAELYTYNTVD